MNIKAISTPQFNSITPMNFTGKKEKPVQQHKPMSMAVKIPVAAFIAMSPIVVPEVKAQDALPRTPEEIIMSTPKNKDPKTKVLDVKTFFNVNGKNYIVKTKSTDGDHSNFEKISISQATPNTHLSVLQTKELSRYNYAPLDDAGSNNHFFTIEGVKTEDTDTQQKIIGNEKFIEYFEELVNSPANNGAIAVVNHNEVVVPILSGRLVSSIEDGNAWEDAEQYCPKGAYLGEKQLEGDHGLYTITVYNSDKQDLTAEEFTLQKGYLPELKIDKMIKVKSNFITDKEEPITYETYQFNLRDENGATTVIHDQTLGEYMEKVCKSVLYNKKDVPFEKAEIENDYKMSASNGRIYLQEKD